MSLNKKPWDRPARQPKKKKVVERGIVAGVPSGDRLLVFINDEAGSSRSTWTPPKKKEIKLSWIQAPRPSALWYDENDEEQYREADAFFWESKEFLRKLTIGKQVEITINSKPQDAKGDAVPRELGTVVLQGEKDDLTRTIIKAGWAEVRIPDNADKSSPLFKDLLDLEAEAKKAACGIHVGKKEKENAKHNSRDPIYDFDQFSKFKDWKGNKISGIVESVITGSMIRVLLVPSLHSITLRISGVRAPNFRKDGTNTEPFGKESQWTTERYTLHRDVDLLINGFDRDKKEEGQDKEPNTGTFHGELFIKESSIGELLIQSGLASFVEWSCPKDKVEKYRGLEKAAADSKLRIWSVPGAKPASPMEKKKTPTPIRSGTVWTGRVKGVTSGNTLVIENLDVSPTKLETVTLSSINAPKFGHNDKPDDPLAWEAREFVRKKVIGKKVNVTVDYVRPEIEAKKGESGTKLPAKSFHTVEFEKTNIALGLVENGFASVIERSGDHRSTAYDALVLAQDRAKKKGLGIHAKTLSRHSLNDISRDARKAKTLYQGLASKSRHEAVVEYVISGSKLKLSLPKEGLIITLSLSGVKTPSVPPKPREGEAPKPVPPFAVEALDFTRNFCHQHDVEIELDGQDKAGQFKGYLFKGKKNLSEVLLNEGLGSFLSCKKYENNLIQAEDRAKAAKKRLWVNYDPVKEEQLRKKQEEEKESSTHIKLIVKVTEVIDATQFYVQVEGEDKQKLDKLMQQLAAKDWAAEDSYSPDKGEVVLAQFSGDDLWYRAKVLNAGSSDRIRVLYGDFGNSEITDEDHIREIPDEFNTTALKFQARECSLAYIKPQKLNQDYGEKAALVFKRLVWDKPMVACVEYTRTGVMYLTLWDEGQTCVNGELVRKGLAQVEKRPHRDAQPEFIDFLREQEDEAHYKKHKGIWQHGDPGGSDGED